MTFPQRRLMRRVGVVTAVIAFHATSAGSVPVAYSSTSVETVAAAITSETTSPTTLATLYRNGTQWGIYRKNKRIGTHTMKIEESANTLTVSFESSITVTMLKVPVYRFRYQSTETWVDGQLNEVDSSTTENGDTTTTKLRQSDGKSNISGPAGEAVVPVLNYASNHWNPGVLESTRIFNTITGEADVVTIAEDGSAQLEGISDGTITYKRYRYSGELELVSWYDLDGRWVGMQFSGDDGSLIEYRLDTGAE